MKNILVIGALPPPTGGMETVTEQMSDMRLKNYNIKIFNVSKNKVIKSNIIFNILAFFYRCLKLPFYIIKYNPEIIHIHVSAKKDIVQKSIFQNICKLFNKKTILHMHGSRFKEWYSSLTKNRKNNVKKFINKSDDIIVLSESWKQYYSKIYEKETIFVINNAIENIDFKKYKRIYPKNEFIILFLGSICERKGAYDLLKAISSIKDSKIRFVFVGPYEDEKRFIEKIEDLQIKDKCILIGEVIGKERFKYFASADAYILPSYAEGLPVTILEAMSFGLPIISTTIGAIPEVITKDNGILIKPGDVGAIKKSILYLQKNKKNILYISKENKRVVNSKYTLKIFSNNLEKCYNEMMR